MALVLEGGGYAKRKYSILGIGQIGACRLFGICSFKFCKGRQVICGNINSQIAQPRFFNDGAWESISCLKLLNSRIGHIVQQKRGGVIQTLDEPAKSEKYRRGIVLE